MYFADFIERVFQIINRLGLSQSYTAVAFGVIAAPEQDYWETSAEHSQGERCDGLERAWEVRGSSVEGIVLEQVPLTWELYHWLCWGLSGQG